MTLSDPICYLGITIYHKSGLG